MKNYLTTSLKSSATAALLIVFSLFGQTDLWAQPDATVSASATSFCAELGTTLSLDGGTTYSFPVFYNWTGPDGWTSTDEDPDIDITSVDQAGDYCLTTVDGLNQTSVEVCVTITVENLIEWDCPSTLTVTPDLTSANCDKNLEDFTFEIDAINCAGTYDYCITMTLEDGNVMAPTSGGPVAGTNLAGIGIYPTVVGGTAVDYNLLPFGFHTLAVDIKNGAGDIVTQCLTEVRVLESINNVACNDEVNLTLTNDCQATITPDMILQGDYCFDNFEISMEGVDPTNEIMLTAPGSYTISVTNQLGITCWGVVLAEDKTVPIVECQDPVTMYCSQTTFIPGSSVCGYGKYTNATTPALNSGVQTVALSHVSGSLTGTVKSAWLNITGEITDLSDLVITLNSPDPANGVAYQSTIQLADFGPGGGVTSCTNPNMCISLADDTSYKAYSMFFDVDECYGQENAYIGAFQPENPFSGFAGDEVLAGVSVADWTLELASTAGFDDLSVELIVLTDEGSLLTSDAIMQNQGCSTSDITIEYEDESLANECEGGNWQRIERTWTATNNTTQLQGTCSQEITFLPWTLDDIIWPVSRDGVKSEILDCALLFDADWNLDPSVVDENGIPLPVLTGSPRVPFGELCGNYEVTYEDIIFELCGEYSKKIVRKWAVFEWCASELREYNQIIKIVDRDPIQMTCAPDSDEGIIVNDSNGNPIEDSNGNPIIHWKGVTDGNQCAGTWEIEPPLVIQNACDAHTFDFTVEFLIADADGEPPLNGDYVSFDPATGANVIGTLNPTAIENLPLGVTWLKYSVEDECGNTGVCYTEVAIVDETRPTPVCIENTVVAVGDDGCAYLPAESIDNTSWDNCGVVTYEIMRPTGVGGWTDVLSYCCECMMNDEEVYLRVTDAAGNSNSCVVNVEIQNNTNPSVSGGPANQDRDCEAGAFDLYAISEAGKATFNFVTNCSRNTTSHSVVATVNGVVVSPGDTYEPGECGIGNTTIKYEVFDDCMQQVGSAHNQSLRYTNDFNGFNVTRWPVDYTIPNCVNGTEPENLPASAGAGHIRTTSSGCGSDTAITYEDQVFPEVDDACFKILREWTVIDWCIVNAPGGTVDAGKRTYTQLIKVNDSSAPVITNPNEVSGDDPSCQLFLTEDDVEIEIADNCTPEDEIVVSYEINGTPAGSIFGRAYDDGDVITIYATDHCDNVSSRTITIRTLDTEAPVPYCLAEVVTTVNASGFAEIWVSDFSNGAQDNCDPLVDDYFINELGLQTQVLTYDCDDIPNGVEQIIEVIVYFEDDSGNVNTCNVRVHVQDNPTDGFPEGYCPDAPGSRIAGRIVTEDDEMVKNVMVELMLDNSMMNSKMTEDNGEYAFANAPNEYDYVIMPHKDDSYLNGVSTIDLVMIQRHILGLERFSSPYKLIAADTDNSGQINGIDLVELRKLILGINTELPHGQLSWRLPVKDQTFANPASPFPFQETIVLDNLRSDMNNQNFVAVKIGDVNGSALTTGKRRSAPRSSTTMNLEVEDMSLAEGTVVTIPVYAKDIDELIGLQTTLTFNPTVMEFVGIEKAGLDISEAHLGLHSLKEGYISLSWNNVEGVALAADEALFELTFHVNGAAQLSEQFFLSSALTSSEAYSGNMETMHLNLNYKGADLSDFVLYQNIPNPFADNTEIRFSLPATSEVTFTVYNVNGSVILNRTSRFEGGNNAILLNSNELASSGILYYKLETAYGTASRKMIQIR